MSKENILLTGATGFIGGATKNGLVDMGNEVKQFVGDIREVKDWGNNLIGEDIIYLFAGTRLENQNDFEVNAKSIEKLFDSAIRVGKLPKRLILASTQAVYMGNDIPFEENMQPQPTTVYGQSKLEGERNATNLCDEHGVELIVLRYSTVLGKGVREKSKMSGPLFVWTKAALANALIEVYQDGNQTRDYMHVDDVVNANILALDLPNGIYNVGGGEEIKVIDLARWIKQAAGSQSSILIKGGDSSKADPRSMLSDITKLEGCGWIPKKTAKEAVTEFVGQFLAN